MSAILMNSAGNPGGIGYLVADMRDCRHMERELERVVNYSIVEEVVGKGQGDLESYFLDQNHYCVAVVEKLVQLEG